MTKVNGVFIFFTVMIILAMDQVYGQSNPFAPKQVHLSFGSQGPTTTGMWVTWVSENQTVAPIVMFGTSASSLTSSSSGVSTQYFSTTSLSWKNVVSLTGLNYDTTYYYKAGTSASGFSSIYSFATPPQQLRPFTAAVYGDMGTLYADDTRTSLIKSMDQYEWVFHLGDIAYSGMV